MFNSAVIDVALGLTFVFILVSTLCSGIREGLEAWLKTRATYLEYAIRELLHDRAGTGLARSLLTHPLISGLYQGNYRARAFEANPKVWQRGRNFPSYIPARSFALALMDLAARGPSTDAASGDPELTEMSFASLRANVVNLQNVAVQRALLAALDSAQGNLELARKNLEHWYDGAMDRVSGWYKRSTQWVIFGIALIVVGALNVNAITIADHFYRDPALRSAIVVAAERSSTELSSPEALARLEGLHLPVGWWSHANTTAEHKPKAAFDLWRDLIVHVIGLLLTALAATLGAPFWFDILNKVMVIRATVKPSEKSPAEASLDTQVRGRLTNGGSPSAASREAPTLEILPSLPHGPPTHADNGVDGCDQPIVDATLDEDLPPAKGGVVT